MAQRAVGWRFKHLIDVTKNTTQTTETRTTYQIFNSMFLSEDTKTFYDH